MKTRKVKTIKLKAGEPIFRLKLLSHSGSKIVSFDVCESDMSFETYRRRIIKDIYSSMTKYLKQIKTEDDK